MNKYILDSSALLALFNSDTGSDKIEELLPLSIYVYSKYSRSNG
ncbi:hypothetical protein A1C_02785 [Rickettsia akari str. Hartford]|uniref:PIN domain-containing protein n=1 Tax=Rickettsia akari (strain Hartford) TaxID=293614 RepID=A8GN77_RICAH|nr:hypothetical protein A1C_02785 [Rickettsia akari str. Hartford]